MLSSMASSMLSTGVSISPPVPPSMLWSMFVSSVPPSMLSSGVEITPPVPPSMLTSAAGVATKPPVAVSMLLLTGVSMTSLSLEEGMSPTSHAATLSPLVDATALLHRSRRAETAVVCRSASCFRRFSCCRRLKLTNACSDRRFFGDVMCVNTDGTKSGLSGLLLFSPTTNTNRSE